MKRIYLIMLILLTCANFIFAQFTVTLKTSKVPFSGDTIRACFEEITFTATAKNGVDTVNKTSNFSWDFGDNTMPVGNGLFQVKHTYEKGGGYHVRVVAKNGANTDYAIIPVEISQKANFSGTKSNVPKDKGICDSEEIALTGIVNTQKWKYIFINQVIEPAGLEVNNSPKIYKSVISHLSFKKDAILNNINMLDSVGIKLEHSNAADLQIKLTCPNGNSVILKDFGGFSYALGQPVLDETVAVGVGKKYFWTNAPMFGTLSATSTGAEGTYKSENDLTNLIGCPLNGDWTMEVTDNNILHNGFVFGWELRFNKDLPIPKFNFENTYVLTTALWDGDGVQATSQGLTTANPKGKGNSGYKFVVKDNFGCINDTVVTVKVEGVVFQASPSSGDAPLRVSFTNTTTWAKTFDWDLGIDSAHVLTPNTSHTYLEKGKYKVKLTAISETGCKDWDTITIVVTMKPPKVSDSNVFSPNGDGKNDVFLIVKPEDVFYFSSFEGKIYSRFGNPVCVWNNVEEAAKGWDGTIGNKGGAKASSGVYYFVITAKGKEGTTLNEKGSVHLYIEN